MAFYDCIRTLNIALNYNYKGEGFSCTYLTAVVNKPSSVSHHRRVNNVVIIDAEHVTTNTLKNRREDSVRCAGEASMWLPIL